MKNEEVGSVTPFSFFILHLSFLISRFCFLRIRRPLRFHLRIFFQFFQRDLNCFFQLRISSFNYLGWCLLHFDIRSNAFILYYKTVFCPYGHIRCRYLATINKLWETEYAYQSTPCAFANDGTHFKFPEHPW